MYSPVIAHIHVPKTAGAAFRTLLRNRFGTDHSDLDVADTYFVYSEPEIEAHIAERPSLRSQAWKNKLSTRPKPIGELGSP